MIISVITIFGPLPAVFLCEGENTVRFAGFGFYAKTFAEENTVVVNAQIPRLISLISSSLTQQQGGRK
jgi:hypothetical protein